MTLATKLLIPIAALTVALAIQPRALATGDCHGTGIGASVILSGSPPPSWPYTTSQPGFSCWVGDDQLDWDVYCTGDYPNENTDHGCDGLYGWACCYSS